MLFSYMYSKTSEERTIWGRAFVERLSSLRGSINITQRMCSQVVTVLSDHQLPCLHGLLDSSCEAGTDTEARAEQLRCACVYYNDHVIAYM